MSGRETLASLDKKIEVLKTTLIGIDGKNGVRGTLLALEKRTNDRFCEVENDIQELTEKIHAEIRSLDKAIARYHAETSEAVSNTITNSIHTILPSILDDVKKPKITLKNVVYDTVKTLLIVITIGTILGLFIMLIFGKITANEAAALIQALKG